MENAISEGLRVALSKGESLQQAMQSFYNAGYDTKEIQEAARELQSKIPQPTTKIPAKVFPKYNPTANQKKQEPLPVENSFSKPPIQKVSIYEQKQADPRRIIVVIIGILLLMLVLALGIIFVFRNNILNALNSLFSGLK